MIEMMKLDTFRFRSRFSEELSDTDLTQALQVVNAQFSGVYELWCSLPPAIRDAKRELCISYLIAWQVTNMHPDYLLSGSGMGAMPLKSKKAGPISITYRDSVRQGGTVLDSLTTNEFGIQALLMFQTAPETYLIQR